MFRKLFGKGKSRADDVQVDAQADELLENWYQHKKSKLDAVLGKADERVLHFMIADPDRGPFDTVFYRNDVPGTGMATCQLARLDGTGLSNSVFQTYEMIIFTRETYGAEEDLEDVAGKSPGGLLRAAMSALAAYAISAQLEPGSTLEFPADYDEYVGGRCFIVDSYKSDEFDGEFGLMLVIEIHRDEMAFAMENHGSVLLAKLVDAGVYPYSDMNRVSVLGGQVQ